MGSIRYAHALDCVNDVLEIWHWVTTFHLISHVSVPLPYPPKCCAYNAVWLLHGWCHVKLLPSRWMFCVHHIIMHNLHYHFVWSHIRRVHVCFVLTCQTHVWQNDQESFACYCGNRGWNGYWNGSCTESLPWESNPRPFDRESDALPLNYPHYQPNAKC